MKINLCGHFRRSFVEVTLIEIVHGRASYMQAVHPFTRFLIQFALIAGKRATGGFSSILSFCVFNLLNAFCPLYKLSSSRHDFFLTTRWPICHCYPSGEGGGRLRVEEIYVS